MAGRFAVAGQGVSEDHSTCPCTKKKSGGATLAERGDPSSQQNPWSHLDVRSPAPQMTWRARVERFFQSVRDLKQAGKTPALRLIARGGVAPVAGPRRPWGSIKWSKGSPVGRKEGQGQQKVRAFVKKGTPTGGQGLSRFPGLRPLNGKDFGTQRVVTRIQSSPEHK